MWELSNPAQRFEQMRPLLVRHAYRMLGQYGDAEDAVQDAYIRWHDAAQRTQVLDDRAFLRATVTNLCLDRLSSARARREVYVGPWLPEPIIDNGPGNPEAAATLADDISFALLLVLERLAPLERAAFLLHDALGVPFEEVAQTLGRSVEAVRKLASRARERVREEHRAPRTSKAVAERIRDDFIEALKNDDTRALERLLTDDVVFTSDGGGKAAAATVPVVGRDRVSKLILGLTRKGRAGSRSIELANINGLPGYVIFGDAGITTTLAFEITREGIAAIYTMRNPDKLQTIAAQLDEAR